MSIICVENTSNKIRPKRRVNYVNIFSVEQVYTKLKKDLRFMKETFKKEQYGDEERVTFLCSREWSGGGDDNEFCMLW